MKQEANMSWKKYVLISALCQIVGWAIGMVLGLGLMVLVCKLGLLEKFL